MSPNELKKALDRLDTLHREIMRRADLEAEAAVKANGGLVPEDPVKAQMVDEGERLIENIQLACREMWNAQRP